MKYFLQLSVWMYLFVYYVCITCTCIFVYMYVIDCWNGCTDMFYNCVIFVILNLKKKITALVTCDSE